MKDLTLERHKVDSFICGLRLTIVQLEQNKQIDYDLYMKLEKDIKELSHSLEIVFSLLDGSEPQFLYD